MSGGNFLVIALAVVQAVSAFGQTEPKFEAGTREVLVDTLVTDKKGNVPRDLTAENFRLLEDSKEQKIHSFSFTGSDKAGGTGRHFVALLFDTDEPQFREAARQFVDRFAGPDLYVAIYARVDKEIHLVLPFTTNAVRIRDALSAMQIGGDDPWFLTDKKTGRNPKLDQLNKLAADLALIRGRKALVLFTIGLTSTSYDAPGSHGRMVVVLTPWDREWLETIDICNQANVAVYGFNINPQASGDPNQWYFPEGTLPGPDGREYRPVSNTARTTNRIRDLAVGTGGRYGKPGSNQLASFIGGVASEQDEYYLLGYTPTGPAADKNCHKLKVTVDRKGLDVQARDSYCEAGIPDSSLKPAQRALEARAARGDTGAAAMSMQATWFYARRNAAVADMAVDIDPSAMRVRGRLHGEISVAGVASRGDGSVAARFGDVLDLKFETQAQMDEFQKRPFHYSYQVNLAPGSYQVRVSAGSADGVFGSVEKPIVIAPWSGETPSASSIAVGVQDRPVTDATAELDSALLEGRYRLVSQGRELVPIGVNRFRRGQEGLLYIEIYEPGTGAAAPVVEFSVVDRASGEIRVDSGFTDTRVWMREGNSRIPILTRLPSADLVPGDYTVEVRAQFGDGTDTVVRRADFEVR